MARTARPHAAAAPNASAVFRALANPRRREILRLVRNGERTAGDIAANFGVTRPAVSQDLQALARAGLLRARRDATRRLYAIRPEGLRIVEQFLREFWSERLIALKHAAEATHRSSKR
jgi:DNA-binding transcriptional ArsR family regulator